MIEFIKQRCPEFSHFEELELINEDGSIVGCHVSAILNSGVPIGGGTSSSKEIAKRIAIAELLERMFFEKIQRDGLGRKFMTDIVPSTSGFAFGFNRELTRFRAIAEGMERWIWSKWIDEGYYIKPDNLDENKLTALGKYLYSKFDRVDSYSKLFKLKIGEKNLVFKIGIILGVKDDGIFPGSRVSGENADVWEHGLIEAFRHLNIYQGRSKYHHTNNIINDRINYFGSNSKFAFNQIKRSKKIEWPEPKLLLLKEFQTLNKSCFMWRALMENFIPWTNGDRCRFVY